MSHSQSPYRRVVFSPELLSFTQMTSASLHTQGSLPHTSLAPAGHCVLFSSEATSSFGAQGPKWFHLYPPTRHTGGGEDSERVRNEGRHKAGVRWGPDMPDGTQEPLNHCSTFMYILHTLPKKNAGNPATQQLVCLVGLGPWPSWR